MSAHTSSETHFDLVVIGAGPGGYVAAIRATQLGLKVACIEREPELGGTCLRVGCIPSKALLESSELFHQASHDFAEHGIVVSAPRLDLAALMARKDKTVLGLTRGVAGLFKKHQVARFFGHGRLAGAGRVRVEGAQPVELSAKHVLLATGSKVAALKGVVPDGQRILTSTEALALSAVPSSLIVIGAGAIGLELGSVWSRLGAKVRVLEYAERILPGMDAEIAQGLKRSLEKQGLEFLLGARVESAAVKGDQVEVRVAGREPLSAERVLLAVGRVPNTDGLGLETIGLAVDPRGRIPVNAHFQTSAAGVYAIGDVIAGPMLAHKAEEEGIACVEGLVTGYGHVNYAAIPSVVYTHPEAAGVGATQEELESAGTPYKRGSFPFSANGRARALGQTEGLVKVLAHAETDRILGVHIVGPRAGDLIAEAAVAIEFGASAEDLARSCHAHPTLPEALKEAALAVAGRAIHF
jgi:dihydrolipoamide dehydrogenase